MNVLIVSDFQIYPFTSGASIAQFGIIEPLSKKCSISLVIPEQFTPTDEQLDELKSLIPSVKIYTLKGSKSIRFQSLKGMLKNIKKLVEQVFSKKSNESVFSLDDQLGGMHSYLYPLRSKNHVNKILDIIEKDKIDIIQLEFDSNLNLVSLLPKDVKKVFIEHECQFYRIGTHMKAKHINTGYAGYIYNLVKTIEVSFLKQFDSILTFNEDETRVLESVLQTSSKGVEIITSPFPVLDRDFVDLNRGEFHQPDKLVFVGSEYHFPNKDGIEWFLEETALRIFKQFGLRLYIVSGWSQETIDKYKNHPSQVTFTGYLENLYSLTKNSITIAPMRIGGGLRAKILSSMAQGTPVISTTHALSGISAKHMESVMIADDPTSFCSAVDYLLSDVDRTFNLCKNAQELMNTRYSQSYTSEKRHSVYKDILSRPSEG